MTHNPHLFATYTIGKAYRLCRDCVNFRGTECTLYRVISLITGEVRFQPIEAARGENCQGAFWKPLETPPTSAGKK